MNWRFVLSALHALQVGALTATRVATWAIKVATRATVVSTLIELAGLVVLVYGVGLIYRPAGFILGGLCLLLVGFALDPPAPRRGSEL